MVTPVINNIVPFDSSVGTIVNFTYTGGITNSYFEIFNTNNEIIYDSRNDDRIGISQLKKRIIPPGIENLVNNAQYYIQLTVENNDEFATSQKKLFRCITTPILSTYCNDGSNKPLSDSYVLETATFELYVEYTQAVINGKIYEDLNSYQFILYDDNYQVVYTSDVYYNIIDSNNEHVYIRINGLEQKRYFLKVIGKTVNGYIIENPLITVDVEYKANPQKTALHVENCYEEGTVKIGTNIHALMYRLKYEPAKFVDDVIQLRDNWLEYYDGFTIDGDYVAYVRFKNPNYNRNLVRISGNGHNVYMNCYKHDTYMSIVELEELYGDDLPNENPIKSSFLYFDLIVDTNTHITLTSDIFDVEKMKDAWFNAYIVRKGSTYSFLVIPDKYKLTYVLYDGSNDSRNPLNYAEGDELYFYDANKRGNTFKGWYYNPSYSTSSKIISPITAPGEPITIYARFVPCVYKISYILPDGATHTNVSSYTYGTTTTLSDAKKTGYNFIGWYTEEEFENKITEIGNDEIDDKVLYANFEPMVWNMIYNLNGGTNNPKNPSTYTTDAEVMLYSPTRQGYTFKGWYYDYSYTNEVPIPFIAPISNTTVYAKWAVNTYTITYVDAGVNNSNPTTYTYGSSVSLKSLSRTGYTFGGWYLDDEYTLPMSYISSTTYGDLVLYAKWNVQTYTISYINAKDDNPNPTSYTYGTEIVLQSLSKEGYDFGGWYTNSSYTNQITSITSTMSGNLTLYAKWNPKTYNITYVVDADVENTNPTTYTYGTTTSLKSLSRTGYTFGGWYLDSEYSTSISSISNTSMGDITVYAKWDVVYYTIGYKTFYYDPISEITVHLDACDNPTKVCIEDDIVLSNGIIDNDSYEFDGWYLSLSPYDCDYTTKITNVNEISFSYSNEIKYLYPKIVPKEWYAYICDDSTMTATMCFTDKALNMTEFYIPNEYNGYAVNNIRIPRIKVELTDDSLASSLLQSNSSFVVDKNNQYFISDDNGNLFGKYSGGGSLANYLVMYWFNDENQQYCSETLYQSAFTIANNKFNTSYSKLYITKSATAGHNNLLGFAIPTYVYASISRGTYKMSTYEEYTLFAPCSCFTGCANLTDIYWFETGYSGNAYTFARDLYTVDSVERTYSNNRGKYGTGYLSIKNNCNIYVKDSTTRSHLVSYVPVGVDWFQTIPTTYDWTLPDELK